MAKSSRVVLFALIKENKILLEKRPIRGFFNHQYLIPGGAINNNEALEDALKREMHEELGVTPVKFTLLTDEDIIGLYDNTLKPFVVTSWHGDVPLYILDKEDPYPLEWINIDKALNILPVEPTRKITQVLKEYLDGKNLNKSRS